MVYHRLPYEKREINGQIKRVPPKSPNGIIPSLLGFFENGRSGAWIAWEEQLKKNVAASPNNYIDEERYPNLISSSVPLSRKDIDRSEEHTSELQSLMRISYAVFCLKKNK